jgi:hypothetical protein
MIFFNPNMALFVFEESLPLNRKNAIVTHIGALPISARRAELLGL